MRPVQKLAKIKVSPNGLGLHRPLLDADLYVPGLIEGAFGTGRWMQQIGKLGGLRRSRSPMSSDNVHGQPAFSQMDRPEPREARGGSPRRVPSVLHYVQSTDGQQAQCAVTLFAVTVPVNVTSGVPLSLNSVPLSGEPG